MRMQHYILILLLCYAVGQISCSTIYRFRSNYKSVNALMHETENLESKPFLKAHMQSGDVCILADHWIVDPSGHFLSGIGERYDFNRNSKYSGPLNIPVDSVAIFETNTKIEGSEVSRVRALALLAGMDAALGIYCLTNYKACFGSCPTFYLNDKAPLTYADAEGFSSAVTPSMEYADIDALNGMHVNNGSFAITMKNEALETHCVNNINILAYPLSSGERVYHTPDDAFFLCKGSFPVSSAEASEGNVTSLLDSADRKERFSLADSFNLNTREEVYLTFNDVKESSSLGLLLHFRQTLMTTYFIYSALSYMGDEVGDVLSRVERNHAMIKKLHNGIKEQLGDVDVYIWNPSGKRWVKQSGFYEVGPIAVNKQMMPLPNWAKGPHVRVKLILNKGLWRLDYAALTEIKQRVDPPSYSPSVVFNKGLPDTAARAALLSPDRHLVTMPGNEYKLLYDLPPYKGDYEIFLYSKGYYLEWIRPNWIAEKNFGLLHQMIQSPKQYLKTETGNYKRYEKAMEETFWNSRIDTKKFSYYEK